MSLLFDYKKIYFFVIHATNVVFFDIIFTEEPCTSGTTPIISHCPTIVGEGSGSGVAVMRSLKKSNSQESTSSDETIQIVHKSH